MFVRLRLKQGLKAYKKYRILYFDFIYASFKQVDPWSWHIEIIPGVSNSRTSRQAHFTDCL